MKTKEQKIAYVQKKMAEGFRSYYGLESDEIPSLGIYELEVEYDCAVNWTGEE